MPGNLNKIWEALQGTGRLAFDLSRSQGWGNARKMYRGAGLGGTAKMATTILRGEGWTATSQNPLKWAFGGTKTSRGQRAAVSMAARGMSGAITGALVGGAWGAASDNETILGGAMKGAFVGAAGRMSSRGFNFRATRGMTRFTQVGNMRENVSWAMNAMNSGRVRGMRNWVVGSAVLGAAQGMLSGEDNPVGGAIGGAIAGGVRGAAMYGAYRGLRRWRGYEGPVKRGKSLMVI